MHALGHLILVAMWLLGLPVAGLADDVITVRVSAKVIRSVDGRLPDGVDLSLLASVIRSDLSLPPPAWWRGYHLVLVDPITPIGGANGRSSTTASRRFAFRHVVHRPAGGLHVRKARSAGALPAARRMRRRSPRHSSAGSAQPQTGVGRLYRAGI